MNGFREELIKSLSGINGDFIIYESTDKEISKLLRQHGAKTSEELDAEKK